MIHYTSAAGVRAELERQLAAAEMDAASYKAECEARAGREMAAEARTHHLEKDLESAAAEVAREKKMTEAARREAERWRAEVGYYREHRSAGQVEDVRRWSEQRAAEEERIARGETAPLTPGQRDAESAARADESEQKAVKSHEYGQHMAGAAARVEIDLLTHGASERRLFSMSLNKGFET